MRIAIGSDHAGYNLKADLAATLGEIGHDVADFGTTSPDDAVDYPDVAAAVATSVASGDSDTGILVCGSGNGVAIAANKIDGIRAAVIHDVTSARAARAHNDANVACIGERFVGPQTAHESILAFLDGEFEGGRHIRRIAKISELETT
ncbi:MAG: ribose 5-phosphate isomerase B [Acidimicrobiia bacterium]|jgi:ribose 5-phosphate isomerase B|nr:ribose 5-phosphate isomerase B [Acidimicrobiia bacterium]MBP8179690.1 ribose 5-phosphate isomerase B [Acidimicrobiia bacterium]